MIRRRPEDRIPKVLFLSDTSAGDSSRGSPPFVDRGASDGEEIILVWSSAGGGLLAIDGRARRLGDGPMDRERVEAQAAGWHRERVWLRQRVDSGERFVVFSEQMTRARSRREVLETLIEHTAAIVGGFRVHIWSDPAAELLAPTLIQLGDHEGTRAFASLLPVLEAAHATFASTVGIGGGHALVVLERRSERKDDPRHWYLLRATAAQARAALERLAGGRDRRLLINL